MYSDADPTTKFVDPAPLGYDSYGSRHASRRGLASLAIVFSDTDGPQHDSGGVLEDDSWIHPADSATVVFREPPEYPVDKRR